MLFGVRGCDCFGRLQPLFDAFHRITFYLTKVGYKPRKASKYYAILYMHVCDSF